MKKYAIALVVGAVSVAVLAVPQAGADEPLRFDDAIPWDGINPCTGEPHSGVTTFAVSVHEGHENNFVLTTQRGGWTDDRYVVISGVESQVENRGGFHAHFMDMYENPETGERFQARGVWQFNANTGETKKFSIVERCL